MGKNFWNARSYQQNWKEEPKCFNLMCCKAMTSTVADSCNELPHYEQSHGFNQIHYPIFMVCMDAAVIFLMSYPWLQFETCQAVSPIYSLDTRLITTKIDSRMWTGKWSLTSCRGCKASPSCWMSEGKMGHLKIVVPGPIFHYITFFF